jgi:hypothetical protein
MTMAKKKAVQFVDLGPSAPPVVAPAGKSLQWVSLTIGAKAALPVAPTRIEASTGDVVVWVISNQSGRTVSLTLKDFKRRSDGRRLKPVQWIQERVSIPNRGTGLIAGRVTYLSKSKAESEAFRYTIEVRGPGAVDYDPDLEIRPPA